MASKSDVHVPKFKVNDRVRITKKKKGDIMTVVALNYYDIYPSLEFGAFNGLVTCNWTSMFRGKWAKREDTFHQDILSIVL